MEILGKLALVLLLVIPLLVLATPVILVTAAFSKKPYKEAVGRGYRRTLALWSGFADAVT